MIERSLYPRMAVVLMALIGFFNAAYLLLSRYRTDMSMACPVTGGGCEKVRDSAWSTIPPEFVSSVVIPVALLGVLGYSLIFGLGLVALQTDQLAGWSLPPLLVGLGIVGMLFSAYLISLQLFVIQGLCFWCMLSSALMSGILLAALYDWHLWRQHRLIIATQ